MAASAHVKAEAMESSRMAESSLRSEYLLALAFGQAYGADGAVPTFVPTEVTEEMFGGPTGPPGDGGITVVDGHTGPLAGYEEHLAFFGNGALGPSFARAIASWRAATANASSASSRGGFGVSPVPSRSPTPPPLPRETADAIVPQWTAQAAAFAACGWPVPSLRVPRTPLGPRAAIPTMGHGFAGLPPPIRIPEGPPTAAPISAGGPSSSSSSSSSASPCSVPSPQVTPRAYPYPTPRGPDGRPAAAYRDGTPWSREEALRRYREKRSRRRFERRVLYNVRQEAAAKRVRISGRFVSRKDVDQMLDAGAGAPLPPASVSFPPSASS
eukprot:tig00021680_g23043.t1